MTSMMDVSFWVYLLLFIGAIGVAWYIPGEIVLRRLKYQFIDHIVLSLTIGMVMWGLVGLIIGYADVRWVSYVYVVGFLGYWLRVKRFNIFVKLKDRIKIDRIIVGLIVFGAVIQILPLLFSGYGTQKGIQFCCFWPDNLYHIAVTSELVEHVPPMEAGMSDIVMKNYHYLGNLVVADMVRVFHLPLIATHNRFIPIAVSLLLGLIAWRLAVRLIPDIQFARWFLFFLLFSGNIIFILMLILGRGVDFSLNVTESATTLWFSPPRVFAMVVLLAGLMIFLDWIKNQSLFTGFIVAVLIGSLISFKVYIGIFALIGCGVIGLYYLVRLNVRMMIPLLVMLGISLILYLPVNKDAGGIVYTGLWRIEDFAVRPALGLIGLEHARQHYLQFNNFVRVIQIELIFFSIFVFSWLGIFLIGVFQSKKSLSKFPVLLHVFMLSGLFITSFVGLFFIQEKGGSNTVQFLFNAYIVGSLYAALACWYWLQKIPGIARYGIITVIVVLVSVRTLNDVYSTALQIYQNENAFVIPHSELHVLTYLTSSNGEKSKLAIDPAIAMEDNCYYIGFLSKSQQFLCGAGILEDHGVDINERVAELETIFSSKDPGMMKEVIDKHGITHVYVKKDENRTFLDTVNFLKPIQNTDTIVLYQIIKT